MFGALLGTLKRFKNDEAKQKDKVSYLKNDTTDCSLFLTEILIPFKKLILQ